MSLTKVLTITVLISGILMGDAGSEPPVAGLLEGLDFGCGVWDLRGSGQ